jgi:hypothetical protein
LLGESGKEDKKGGRELDRSVIRQLADCLDFLPAKSWSASGRFLFSQVKRKGEKLQTITLDIKITIIPKISNYSQNHRF